MSDGLTSSFQRISYYCKNEFIWPLNLQVHVYNFAFHAYPHTLRTILLETATIDKSLMLYIYIASTCKQRLQNTHL